MSFSQFLLDNKVAILERSEQRVLALAALRPVTEELSKGLPIFFDQLLDVLAKHENVVSIRDEQEILASAGLNGREFLRLGYTLSHVVHAYGAICQSVTEYAGVMHAPVSAQEFHNLNRCLDIAIAGAVTEFDTLRNLETIDREVESLGIFAHELRNALNRATVASEMIAKGIVGSGGSTSKILQFSLSEMNELITRALSDVRLRTDTLGFDEVFQINELISQLVVTAEVDATRLGLTLTLDLAPDITVKADRHLFLSALGNLVQNAMKFTKPRSNITLKVRAEGSNAIIEVSDHCGGIPQNKLETMFQSFVQQNPDRSGLGLGLIISRKAIEKCHGTLNAQNTEDGCVFRISIPLAVPEAPRSPSIV